MPTSPLRTTRQASEAEASLEDIMAQLEEVAMQEEQQRPAPARRRPSSTSAPSSARPRSRPSSSSSSASPLKRPLPAPPIVGRRNSRSSSISRLSRRPSTKSLASSINSAGGLTPHASAAEWSKAKTGEPSDSQDSYRPSTPRESSAWISQPSTPEPPSTSRLEAPSTPTRLLPRSPTNERTHLEAYAFLNTEAPPSEPDHGYSSSPRRSTSVRSSSSRNSVSARSLRLREDIERTAEELRLRSQEGLRLARPVSVQSSRPSLQSRTMSERNSVSTHNTGAVRPATPSSSDRADSYSETRSVASSSLASAHSPYSASSQPPPWPTSAPETEPSFFGGSPSLASPTRSEARRDRDRDSLTPIRRGESKEWSQSCWMWARPEKTSGSSGGMLSKTALIRDVPAAMKWKIGKRDSSQLLSPEGLPSFDEKGVKGLKEKSSRGAFSFGSSSSSSTSTSSHRDGSWKRVTGVIRDDGYFRIFNEESVILYSYHLPSMSRTDLRCVDHSLFGRPHVVSVRRRSTQHLSSSSLPSSPGLGPSPMSEDYLYICMPSVVAMQSFLVMSLCYARPEYLESSQKPHSPRAPNTPRHQDSTSWSSADEDSDANEENWIEVDSRCRIYRSIQLSINEGRGVGEAGTEIIRPGSKRSMSDRPDFDTESHASSEMSPIRPSSSHRLHRGGGEGQPDSSSHTISCYCEILLDGEVAARTSIRKGTTSPFWTETFTFRDLPPLSEPVVVKIYQHHKTSRPTLIGTSFVRVADLPRSELIVDWWPIKPASHEHRGKQTDTVGELSLSVKISEEVVLPSSEYSAMLQLLTGDTDADLSIALAHEFPSDLEELAVTLLRIHQAEGQLLPRILRLIELEIDGDIKSAAILFRGNSLLTKTIELYLRLIGSEYLELSLGEPIRKLCALKVDVEIDPSKMKPGVKEKELSNNVHELHEWSSAVWNAIYEAREKCPNDIRLIFAHIQKIVTSKYGVDQRKMRSTSISAFIFLRFFVPAVLNPRIFNMVVAPPDQKAQRTLTLVAKTLQGLANFSSFGQKEPWMVVMNSFVQDNTSAFVDFIEHISTPSATARYEWTSPHAAPYLGPYRLRNSLDAHTREGVPLLPHLLDLARDLGSLASHVVRNALEREREKTTRPSTSSGASVISRASRTPRFDDFAERCQEVHDEAQRRGAGLYTPLQIAINGSAKSRAHSATARTPASWMMNDSSPTVRRMASSESAILHIRVPPPASAGSSPTSTFSSAATRRTNRSLTVSGPPTRHGLLGSPRNPSPASRDLLFDTSSNPVSPTQDVFKLNNVPPPLSSDSEGEAAYVNAEMELGGADASRPESPYTLYPRVDTPPGHSKAHREIRMALRSSADEPDSRVSLSDILRPISEPPIFTMPFGSSVPMAVQDSASTQASEDSSAASMSSLSRVEVATAHVVSTGRRESTVTSEGSDSKLKGLLSRMGRKNSRVV